MSEEMKPDFVFDPSETPEEPEIFSVTKETGAHIFNRRSFIETSAVVAAGVVLTSCLPGPSGTASDAKLPLVITEDAAVSDTITSTVTNTPSPTPTKTEVPQDTETPTATPVPLAGQTLPGNVFLRSGPGTYYPPVTKLTMVTHFVVIGRTSDNSWVHVRLDNRTEGWIYAVLTNLKIKFLGDIQVDEAPPTPTLLPGAAGNTAPGQTGIDYSYKDDFGNTFSYTLPCGSEIPAGAVCTCNCVTAPSNKCGCDTEDSGKSSCSHSSGGGKKGCSCDSVHYWYPN